ncbi:DUF1629 domain-containing protein [Xanthomonas campestris pv. campestris]|uniref:imm11 family protein n=1 Tax=Xanthomonas campestris TaxID=339 RepID=UPI001A129D4E|nr:DUF1629 domain-containing protein [Xanthomonas campestris]MBF9172112.1 DUF1629 domain-containing protein [Xanthomonas campestris pv. campestris]MDO0847068.1 DUF1629 domain-containing protein [Xanthomonas campestris pv. campestris]MEB1415124.1 DUF1629 domain-containing protein [Xanthomonas campestris pv. campestris]MEB1460721.1 DUF1629 domain-containing protein [Xanthomonas campestris pv. campestris]MEB1501849.1 DUF1629 domain-containing protein [Xanthomonas campestris pv. campestris]
MNVNDRDVPTGNAPRKGEFYALSPDARGGGPGNGVILENKMAIPLPEHISIDPNNAGLKDLKERPRLRQGSPNQMPDDLDASFRGYWLVSEPLKTLFESLDPDAFAFAECDFTLFDGSAAPLHYLCEVIREIDAIDIQASSVRILTEGYPNGKHYSLVGGAKLAFSKDVVGSAHIFRTPYTTKVFCDRLFKDTLIEHGFGKARNSRGVWLIDAADY